MPASPAHHVFTSRPAGLSPSAPPTPGVGQLIRAAIDGEQSIIEALRRTSADPACDCAIGEILGQALFEAQQRIARLQRFLDAARSDRNPLLAAESVSLPLSDELQLGAVDSLGAIYVRKKLHLAQFRELLAEAEASGDVELEQLCREALWITDATASRLAVELGRLDTGKHPLHS